MCSISLPIYPACNYITSYSRDIIRGVYAVDLCGTGILGIIAVSFVDVCTFIK